ncbi:hypothetical protein [Burkholderia sp. D-99]|uniref:hypothetical protein n=1 Tax=Burkholderia sp. D-99 TaxID=2717316 RepID=UPI00141F2284|nr:hypothetical protein [Burkholderia sp. D-99]NHV24710.1 hypothetical protein [Burkholderia sp. D-99]
MGKRQGSWKEIIVFINKNLAFYGVMFAALSFPIFMGIGLIWSVDVFVNYAFTVVTLVPLLYFCYAGLVLLWQFSSRSRGGPLYFEPGRVKVIGVAILLLLCCLGAALVAYGVVNTIGRVSDISVSLKTGIASQWFPATVTRGVGYMPSSTIEVTWDTSPLKFIGFIEYKVALILLWFLLTEAGAIIFVALFSIIWHVAMRSFISSGRNPH